MIMAYSYETLVSPFKLNYWNKWTFALYTN